MEALISSLKELESEVVTLRLKLSATQDLLHITEDAKMILRADLAAAKADAERYRWLRSQENWTWTRQPMRAITVAWMNKAGYKETDAAIDAAILESKK